MKLSAFIDGRGVVPCWLDGDVVVCDLQKTPRVLHALIDGAAAVVRVRVLLAEPDGTTPHAWETAFLLPQGLAARAPGGPWTFHPLRRVGPGVYEAEVACPDGCVRIANAPLYTRDDLDALLCVIHASNVRPQVLQGRGRGTVVFRAGRDDDAGPVHVILAGEDAGEGASMWAVDAMIRRLADPTPALRRWLEENGVWLVPAVSPVSLGHYLADSYLTPDGAAVYGAATWALAPPPPEFAALRTAIVELINGRRLGLLHTWHSWRAAEPRTETEFIRSAGERTLSAERTTAARRALDAIMTPLPHSQTKAAETIWCPGLARDYFLARHNVVSFRTEVGTSATFGDDYSSRLGTAYLDRLSAWEDWRFVYGD